MVGGLLGLAPDDLRLRRAFEEAEAGRPRSTPSIPSTWAMTPPQHRGPGGSGGDETVTVRGASIGGGRVEVTAIDEFPVALGGDYHTLVLAAHDRPGTIAAISSVFADAGINLATMRVDRTGRHKEALMTIEVDAPISDDALARMRASTGSSGPGGSRRSPSRGRPRPRPEAR
jgi:L-serine dehydratase